MKTIFKKLKKGFTIVELVIVIAVIAILAAVLIPTLANVLTSANESNDIVLVSNLNKIVAAYDTVGEIDTVSDALDGALENGYSVSNLTPTSEGNVIVYDEESNRFALLSADALTTTTPDDDDIIYKDTSTTKTDWTTPTTWVFKTTSDVSTVSGDDYTIEGTNSYILIGEDWNGKSVTASYGVVLYDYSNTVTLKSVTITNTDSTQQKDLVKANSASNAKTTIAKTTTASEKTIDTIIINVTANSLSYTGSVYSVVNYSTIKVTTTIAVGATNTFTAKGTSQVYVVSSGEIHIAAAQNTGTYITNSDGSAYTGTVSYASDSYEGNITTTITLDLSAISSAASDDEISVEDVITAVTVGLGTENYPYLIDDETTLLEKAKEGGYIKLEKNIEVSTYPTIPNGITAVLNLNGYTISQSSSFSYNWVIAVNGELTITDDSENQSGCIFANNYYGILVNGTSAILNIKAGTIKNNGTSVTYASAIRVQYGKVNMTGGVLEGLYGMYLYPDFSTANVSGGTINATTCGIGIYSGSTLNFTGGTINSTYGIYVSGTESVATITSGTVNASTYGVYVYSGTAKISGDVLITATGTTSYGVFIPSSSTNKSATATAEITGGTINAGTYGLYIYSNSYGNIAVSGGNISGKTNAVYVLSKGTISISGGTFSSDPASAYITSGYTSSQNEDGTYTVKPND